MTDGEEKTPLTRSSRRLIKGFKKLLEFWAASKAINLERNQVNNLILTALRLTIKYKRSTDDRCDAPSQFPFFSQKIYDIWQLCEVRSILRTSAKGRCWSIEHLFFQNVDEKLFINEIACATLDSE